MRRAYIEHMNKRTPNEHRLYRMTLEAREEACIRLGKTLDPKDATDLEAYRTKRKPATRATLENGGSF